MQTILLTLRFTPLWVFAVFAVLLWLGILSARRRQVRMWRVLATPAVFIGWGLVTLALRGFQAPLLVADWMLAALAGTLLAVALVRLKGVRVDRGTGLILLPGSGLPLARNMAIFLARYALAVALARAPELRSHLLWWDVAVSGVSAGFFAGWLLRFTQRVRLAPREEVEAVARQGAA